MTISRMFLIFLATILLSSRFNPKFIRTYEFELDCTYNDAWKRCLRALEYYEIDSQNIVDGIIITKPRNYTLYPSHIEHSVTIRLINANGNVKITYSSVFCLISSFSKSKGECYRYLNPARYGNDSLFNIERSIESRIIENRYDINRDKLWERIIDITSKSEFYNAKLIDPINYKLITSKYPYHYSLLSNQTFYFNLEITVNNNSIDVKYNYYRAGYRDNRNYDKCLKKKYKKDACKLLIEKEDFIMNDLIERLGKDIIVIKHRSN